MSNLDLKVSADVEQLQAKMAVAKENLRAFSADTRAAAKAMREAGDAADAELRGKLEAAAKAEAHARAEMKSLRDQMSKATGDLHSRLIVNVSDLEHVHARIRDITGIFSTFSEVFIAGLGIEKLGESVFHVLELADSLGKLSQKTGISVENLSRLSYAAQFLDVNQESLQNGIKHLGTQIQIALAEPTGTAARAFQAAGISMDYLRAHGNDLMGVLFKLADRFHETEDGGQKVAIAQETMGRAAIDLIPLLNQGSAGMERLFHASDLLGKTMGKDFADRAERALNSLKLLKAESVGLWQAIVEKATPAIEIFASALVNLTGAAIASNDPVVIKARIEQLNGAIAHLQSRLARLKNEGPIGQFFDSGAIAPTEQHIAKLQAEVAKLQSALKILNGAGGEGGKPKGQLGNFAGTGPTQIETWKNELQNRLIAEQNFFSDSRREELAFWESKLALVKKGSKDAMAVEREIYTVRKALAVEGVQDDLAAMDAKIQAAHHDYNAQMAIEEQKLALLRRTYGEDSRQYQAVLREKERMEQEHTTQLNRMALERANTMRQVRSMGLEAEKQRLEQEVSSGETASAEKFAQLRALMDKEYELNVQALEDQKKLGGQSVEEQARINNQLLILKAKHEEDLAKLDRQEQDASTALWKSFFGTITRGWDTELKGVLQGTQTWRQAMARQFSDMAASFTVELAKMGAQWLAFETATAFGAPKLAKAIGNPIPGVVSGVSSMFGGGGGAGKQDQSMNRLTAAITGQTTATEANTGGIFNWIGQQLESLAVWLGLSTATTAQTVATATDTAASAGLIPALIANTAALVANTAALEVNSVSNGGGLMAFDVGAWNVPQDMVAQIHKGEMILPASVAEVARRGKGSSGAFPSGGPTFLSALGGGDTNIAVHFQVNGHGGALTRADILAHSRTIADAVARESRNMNPSLRPQS